MKSISFVRETFAAGPSAEITGVSTMQQRNMRRLGHDTKVVSGHERRDAHSLAKLRVMKLMGDYGFPPGAISDLSDSAAAWIYVWAGQEPAAVADPKGLAKGEKPVNGGPDLRRFLVWNGRDAKFVQSVGEHYAEQEAAGGIATAVILDLRTIAQDLVARSQKPFWQVIEVED